MEFKKSAIDLTDLAIGLVVLGIVVTIGATILVNVRDSKLTDLSTVTTNQSLTFSGSTATLANTWGKAVTTVWNATGGEAIGAGNYTTAVDGNGVMTITNLSTAGQPWNATYTWYNTSSRIDYSLANKSAVGIGEFGSWFKIIVIVGIAALVLALIFMAFGRNNQSQSGVSY